MNFLKGVYDSKKEHQSILVTGSASFETFRRSGDSLVGRFFKHRIFPFSPAELPSCELKRFMQRGGFPEPLLTENDIEARRWREQYLQSMVRVDVLDFKSIINLRSMELLIELLRSRVGSPASYASLSQDLQISPSTVKNYISVLEQLFIVFRITPYSNNIARSILKEPKIYFFDIAMVQDERGPRFENLVAFSLYKEIKHLNDTQAEGLSLQYMRTKDKREVDFCIVQDKQAKLLIEAKYQDDSLSPTLQYFHRTTSINALQVCYQIKNERKIDGLPLYRASRFLQNLSEYL